MTAEFDRKTPADAVHYFRSCIKTGNAMGAISCFEPDAIYIDHCGKKFSGLGEIKEVIYGLCSWQPDVVGGLSNLTVIENLAMWSDQWEMTGKTPDGQIIEMTGHTSCLMRRNKEGVWLWLIDNPFGNIFPENN